mmetsp:Transcript_43366/g.109864  ORF Transcript_43366/g.109864 Transcript_43366/m.109864 type:complete len:91 (+) Transcript_43366:82-354(+)
MPRLYENDEGIEKNSVNAKQIVEDTAAGSANAEYIVKDIAAEIASAEKIAEDTAMKSVSVEMESDHILHDMRKPRQLYARRASIAASMVR